jgi:hypothetical protein
VCIQQPSQRGHLSHCVIIGRTIASLLVQNWISSLTQHLVRLTEWLNKSCVKEQGQIYLLRRD